MFELTTEVWTLALAGCLGLLLSGATLALAVQSSLSRSRGGLCILLFSLGHPDARAMEFGHVVARSDLCHRGIEPSLRALVHCMP
jgi:hypothetical protein